MSNIFAPYVRPYGHLPIVVGTGPIPAGAVENQHLWFDETGAIYCSNDVINHYGAALPFDVHGRMVVSEDDVVWVDQDIPFTASGAVAIQETQVAYWDQGLTFLAAGHIAAGSEPLPPRPPTWSTIPNVEHFAYELAYSYDVSIYVSSPDAPIDSYSLVLGPPGFSVNQSGVIEASPETAVQAHTITVRACNVTDCSDQTFTWTIVLGNVPTWTTIPNQSHYQAELEQTLNVNGYASSDSGPITSISLVNAPAGFSIAGGVISVSAGTAVGSYVLEVRAVNGVGAGDTTFTWDILEDLAPPIWSTIPNQSDQQADLPQTLDAALYVTSNSGPLVNPRLITPPAGFSIDAAGVITAAAGTALAAHSIVVAVSNDQGESSTSFTWTISDTLLPPDWSTIPGRTVSEENLPDLYAVHPYVTTNSGPLTGWDLVSPPVGFVIDSAGVVTADDTVVPGVYPITVRVSNYTGSADSAPFDYEITLFYVVPVWSPIPDQTTEDTDLPETLDVTPYVTTNSGPLTNWSLVAPPAGFIIDGSGVITVAAGTSIAAHSVTVRVENDEGSSDSDPFTWTVTDILLPPQWSSVPDQSTREDNLPATLDLTAYVTSNDGPLVGWALDTPPAGFTVSSSGVVTAAAGISPAAYPITARVSNNSGTADSSAFNWTIESFYTVPEWGTIPDQSTEEQLLPVVLDVKPYVTSNHGPLTNWSLVGAPSGWTISTDGIITVAAGRPVGANSLSVRVSNDSGSSDSDPFDWDILEEPEVPLWITVPNKFDRENTLPQNYDVAGYASSNSNSGPLTGWQLVSPPTGFSISGAGVITAAAGTTVAAHQLTVRVFNDVGSSDSAPFTWEIGEELLPPVWSTIPDQSDREDTLPQTLDVTPYVTTNNGTLNTWVLSSAPSGFSINQSGVITCTDPGVGSHSLRVTVSNLSGPSESAAFTWEVLEELLPPQWTTLPDQSDDQGTGTQTLDTSSYVSSNSGPLDTWSITSPITGFSISQSGVVSVDTTLAPTGDNSVTVRVCNDTGCANSSAFTWAINATVVDEDYHEFNAALGNWRVLRSGAAYGYSIDNIDRAVSTDQPVYHGCGWSGSDWTPNAAFLGIKFDRKSTNRLPRSNALTTSPWTLSSAGRTVNSFLPQNTGGAILSYNSQTSGSGTKTISAMVQELSAPNGQIYLTQNAGANAQSIFPGANVTQAKQNTSLAATGVGIAALADTGEIYCQYFQDETGSSDPTGPILTTGSAASRSPMRIYADSDTLGWGSTDLHDGFCGQAKVRCLCSNADVNNYPPGSFTTIYALTDNSSGSTNTSNYVLLSVTAGTGGLVELDVHRDGSSVAIITVTGVQFTLNSDYDFRWRVDRTSGIRLWVTGPGVNIDTTQNATWAAWTGTVDNHQIGSVYQLNEANNDGEGSYIFKAVRLNRTVLTDAEIIAWS